MFDDIKRKIKVAESGILELVKFTSNNISSGSILLDAGAGKCPYKDFFSHTKYISIDFCRIKKRYAKISIIGDLNFLPLKNNSINAILCTQTLEHVNEPSRVLSEFHRVLKINGKLFLTVPQAWEQHQKPYDYFRFTSYGLNYLFSKTGFKTIFIKPIGGYFSFTSLLLYQFPKKLFANVKSPLLKIIIFPFKIASMVFLGFFRYFCFYLDRLDKQKDLVANYACYCKNMKNKENRST